MSTPFAFDTEFDADGSVVRESAWKPTKRSYLPAEVDALVAHAQLEARQQALNEIENIRAMALTNIAQGVAAALPSLRNVAQTHREQSADLALAAARAIGGAALERFPQAPLRAALEALAQEIDASPRLVVRAAGLDDEGRAQIERACADSGFTGVVAFRDEPGMGFAAFQLEWADGRADHDPEGSATRVAEALTAALAAEAGHAEPPINTDRSDF
ncbi:MAG: flagellar assembly protein FlbE [Alphaproteobacteria bacterium]|jgi:flagellar assembly protein FliH|uniref:flagellar assembly protein FlbE n=1 Tax=unclassified Brevundimonas TaxID=2622653 RepID=UPI000DAFC23C|nr:flagellar assembly protein FlbE [Brevundimonas sp.]MBU1270738.1 flagellar assembly protein FlbE [Alphaproteobacteria bacterium]MBJ7317900.1 flagellar assembly protein FlbE [Brevundimonas sp.]MBU1522524.1 flagellar assembly protein FlbE [Alphaproteobacteria bacterium]MBU2032049.1 flagellar assembly protein FlbE [Alphaproteobacteria bacterium]MBU2163791.1 flagellar assembly protein FlbE [Alphaproteobacteria bacterium]